MRSLQIFLGNTKRMLQRKRSVVIVGVTVGVLALAFGLYAIHTHRQQARIQTELSAVQQLEGQRQDKLSGKLAAAAHAADDVTRSVGTGIAVSQPAVAPEQSVAPDKVVKYSVSSDPRSTAYSTTPPGAHPDSFSIRITHSGQLAAGSMLYYNATKGEKGYYGGDLLISGSVVYSKSSAFAPSKQVVVSSPDGAVIGTPTSPWDDRSPNFFIASPTLTMPAASSSYTMIVELYGNPAIGTHLFHIVSGRDIAGNAWQYDGFISVKVVE